MENSMKIMNWIDKATSIWRAHEVTLQSGISQNKISEFEQLLDFKFPQDFIELYKSVNGFEDFDWNKNMFSLWSLDRILKEYREGNDHSYIGFCDYLVNSHLIGFYKIDNRIYKSYGICGKSTSIADSFKEAIVLLNLNSDLLY